MATYYYGSTHVFTNREENGTVNILPLRGTLNLTNPSSIGTITVDTNGVVITDVVTIASTLSGTSTTTAGLVCNGISCSQYSQFNNITTGSLAGSITLASLSNSPVIIGNTTLRGTITGTSTITAAGFFIGSINGGATTTNFTTGSMTCTNVTLPSVVVSGAATMTSLSASKAINAVRPFYSIYGTTASVSITGGVDTELGSAFWTSGFTTKSAGSTLTSTTTGRISVGETAFYQVTCNIYWAGRAAGPCNTYLAIGGTITYQMGSRCDAAAGYATGTCIVKLTSGTYISVFVNTPDTKSADGTKILYLSCTKML